MAAFGGAVVKLAKCGFCFKLFTAAIHRGPPATFCPNCKHPYQEYANGRVGNARLNIYTLPMLLDPTGKLVNDILSEDALNHHREVTGRV